MAANVGNEVPWFVKSTVPVDLPTHEALAKSRADFDDFIRHDLARRHDAVDSDPVLKPSQAMTETSESFTEVDASTTADIRDAVQKMDVDEAENKASQSGDVQGTAQHPFMEGLLSHDKGPTKPPNLENKMLTQNGDLTNISTKDSLVDLFAELEDVITGPRLRELLAAAWQYDSLATLKVIFNARSIHLGKSSKNIFYQCAGWLAQNHPLTLVANLQWLSRPIIAKKQKKDETEDDVVLVEAEKEENDPTKYDIKYGVAHGYWKDLLNILALAVNGKLDCLSDPKEILNIDNTAIIKGKKIQSRITKNSETANRAAVQAKQKRMLQQRAAAREQARKEARAAREEARAAREKANAPKPISTTSKFGVLEGLPEDDSDEAETESDVQTEAEAETPVEVEIEQVDHNAGDNPDIKGEPWEITKRQVRSERHRQAIHAFEHDHVYRALHIAIARLFAQQLETDLAALRGDDDKAKKAISLCAKWAPSHDHFHDRHTFVISTIAEIMHPRDSMERVAATDTRETYLRHAREAYRKDVSALRKHLDVVERHITEKAFENILYDRVPSVAMNRYSNLFAEKDFARFEKYIDRVAEGKANISGATLLPSTLVQQCRGSGIGPMELSASQKRGMTPKALTEHKMKVLQLKVVDGQWNTLVQRIKDFGTLSSAIAVCDVSGSMSSPRFPDGTCPMDSAIGLSLLIASSTAPPFGGAFITFSSRPQVQKIDLSQGFGAQVSALSRAEWNMNTDFVAVFDKLILPMAIKNKIKPEYMVKRVFVFSDMHFDSAEGTRGYNYGRDPAGPESTWAGSYERIKANFERAGYEMPELIFWNLAGGRGASTAPKPVTTTDEGTSLVSGYSQGMLKVFLDSGGFDEPEEEAAEDEGVVVQKGEDGDVIAEPAKKKAKMDPLRTVKKAIGHEAYGMLKVLD